MKDCLFWRVIGVGVVVGLVSIGFGLCKNSPMPSPSFSSSAYADDIPHQNADDAPHEKHVVTAEDRYRGADESLDARYQQSEPTAKPAYSPPQNAQSAAKSSTVEIQLEKGQFLQYRVPKSTVDDVQKILEKSVMANPPIRIVREPEPAGPVTPAATTVHAEPAYKPSKFTIETDKGQKATFLATNMVYDGKSLTIDGIKHPFPIPAATPPTATVTPPTDAATSTHAVPAVTPLWFTIETDKGEKATFSGTKAKIIYDGQHLNIDVTNPPTRAAAGKPAAELIKFLPEVRIDERITDDVNEKSAKTNPSIKIIGEPVPAATNGLSSAASMNDASHEKHVVKVEEESTFSIGQFLQHSFSKTTVDEMQKNLDKSPMANPPVKTEPAVTPPTETKEPSSKPVDDSPTASPKKPRTVKIILETEWGQGWVYDLDKSKVGELQNILGKTIVKVLSPNDFAQAVAPPVGILPPPTNQPTAPYYTDPSHNPPAVAYQPSSNLQVATVPPPTNPPVASYAELLRSVPNPAPPSDMPKLDFKRLNSPFQILRAKVPGGWLISTPANVIFYADPEYKWNGGSIE